MGHLLDQVPLLMIWKHGGSSTSAQAPLDNGSDIRGNTQTKQIPARLKDYDCNTILISKTHFSFELLTPIFR